MKRIFASASACVVALAAPAVASAQANEAPAGAEGGGWLKQSVPAPANAFELGVATGYTQGFGSLASGVGMPSVADAGLGVDLSVGYRTSPRWSVFVSGQYQELSPDRGTGARGLSVTFGGQYHLAPEKRIDPWVELGTGWRVLWETFGEGQNTISSTGIELARVRVGADVRLSEDIAVGPFVGGDLNVFMFQDGLVIDNQSVSTFIVAGAQGRFDIGGTRVGGQAWRTRARR